MKLNTRNTLMLAVTALAVAACGGGGRYGGGFGPGAQNASPVVSAITSQSINQDTPTSSIAFTLSDDGNVDALMLSVISSNTAIVPTENVTLTGTGANRTLTVTPAEDATGSVNITVQAKDAQGLVGVSSFTINVNAVQQSILAFTNTTFGKDDSDTPVQVSGFTFVQDADDDNAFAQFLQ